MKQLKKLIILLVLVLLAGCVKTKNTMTINKDKSMKLETEVLVSDKLLEMNSEYLNKDLFKDFGVQLNDKSKSGYTGYSFSKEFDNIDELSKNHDEEVKLGDLYITASDNNNLFSMTKGFFKDTYTAKYIFDKNDYIKYETVEDDEEQIESEEENEEDMSKLNDISNLTSEMEIVFNVNIPYGSKDNNATSRSNGNKTLTWNLSVSDKEEINFTFVIYNVKNIILVSSGVILLLIIIIVILIIIKKKNDTAPTLIYKEYDPSIEDKIYDGKNPIVDRSKPKKENSLEYNLPEEITKNHIDNSEKGPQFYDSTKFVDEELVFDGKKREKLIVPEMEEVNRKPQ